MFAAHSPASASSGQTNDATDSWVNSHSLLSAQDVLDYSSFSDRSNSPILSIQSLASEQHSPNLDAYCFNDFATPSAASSPFEQALQDQAIAATVKSSANETARQAALLHAYLAAQNLAYTQQLQHQRWDFAAMAQLETATQAQAQLQQQHQLEEAKRREEQEQVVRTQQSDAQNLARYLSQMQKEEPASQEEDMDKADAASDTISAPPSPSSTTSAHVERSPSPESSCQESNTPKAPKSSRKLVCFNCNVTQTPLWRRTPDRRHSLCNACGLYYKQYGAHRPLNVRHKLPTVLADVRMGAMPYARPSSHGMTAESSASSESDSDSGSSNAVSLPALTKMYSEALLRPAEQKITPPLMTAKQGIECANCSQTQTPLWRKNDAGEPICNACGLYAKLHKRSRPVTMRKSKISRRRRDWGGNLAQQAQAQAQALAMVHVQVQAKVQAQAAEVKNTSIVTDIVSPVEPSSIEASLIQEMTRRAQALQGCPAPSVHSSDSEEEMEEVQEAPKQQQEILALVAAPTPVLAPSPVPAPAVVAATGTVAQKLSGNAIMDEIKFSDMVSQMNAHQMNRFLSILESRCGVLRNRLLASTEPDQSSLDHLF
ncbi:hypothetical protein EC957_004151 [Mortierella hygrophila]|uniref:GATA-type domain-containing protein n=1 Tax=Mortierella hygrophila TaxID=979708 RepID=A0A9P6K8F4_9FUNG|nr:hypothetical protein EC957_004151 [Mortierella hygrophila]